MPMFRKKPVTIEAREVPVYPGPRGAELDLTTYVDKLQAVSAWCGGLRAGGHYELVSIQTLEGTMYASPGDWIIKGVQGEFYPIKPDIFAKTYEAVDQ